MGGEGGGQLMGWWSSSSARAGAEYERERSQKPKPPRPGPMIAAVDALIVDGWRLVSSTSGTGQSSHELQRARRGTLYTVTVIERPCATAAALEESGR
jgi:hypothetical protein